MIDPRKRINERFNRARLTLEAKRSVKPLIVIAIGLAIGFSGFLYIVDHIGAGAGGKRSVRFAAPDTTGLVPKRAEVRFKGIHAGIVDDVKIEDGKAVITALLLKEYGPIYRDARAEIRPNTPLQDMYLDIIDRGTKAAGEAGDEPLPAHQTDTSVNIAHVLQVFEPTERRHMRSLLAELGKGLDDRGAQLRRTFAELGPFIRVMGSLSEQLAIRRGRTRRMVHNVGELTQVLASRDRKLRGLVEDGSTVLAATADGRGGLDGMLRELPPALRELDASFATVRQVLPDVDRAVRRLGPVASELPDSLAALRGFSDEARPAVRALHRPLADLVPLSRRLRPFAIKLSDAVTALRPQMPDVATITKDAAGCPVAAYMFFQYTASIGKFGDSLGPYPRGDFGFGLDSSHVVKDPGTSVSPTCVRGAPKGATP